MDPETTLNGSPITLAELKGLGEFVRWQAVGPRVADLVAAQRLPSGYPLVEGRLPTDGSIDLCAGRRWQQVKFVRMEGSRSSGNRRIVYMSEGAERSVP